MSMSSPPAVASRIRPRLRWSRKDLQERSREAARRSELAKRAGFPETVNLIPTDAHLATIPDGVGVAIRPNLHNRRVFVLESHMTPGEMEGLAYRMRALAKSESINSILVAMADEDDSLGGNPTCLPTYLLRRAEPRFDAVQFPDLEPEHGKVYHFSGGYDPLALYERGDHKDPQRVKYVLDSVRLLANEVKGDPAITRVPVITVPNGQVSDSGYALCMGGYVLASSMTRFKIENPSRGLSFDPIGFSYILPRLGWEHKQESAKYPGCGMLLALAGYEATSYDMIVTGLATNLIDCADLTIPQLEEQLAYIDPYHLQGIIRQPRKYYGQTVPPDANAEFRNFHVASLIEEVSEYSINPSNRMRADPAYLAPSQDPAFDFDDSISEGYGFFDSALLDIAATFDSIFRSKLRLEGIVEQLKEVGNEIHEDKEEALVSSIARELVARIEAQSPLALCAVYQLMRRGAQPDATWEYCQRLEQRVQARLMMTKPDFDNWGEYMLKHSGDPKEPFRAWKDADVASVSADEVNDLLSEAEEEEKEADHRADKL